MNGPLSGREVSGCTENVIRFLCTVMGAAEHAPRVGKPGHKCGKFVR